VRKISLPVLIGAIACFTVLTACGANNSLLASSRDAFPSLGCKVWEVATSMSASGIVRPQNPKRVEAGWEPFAMSNYGLSIRRCVQS
jgi:hypothetical protein